MSIRLDPKHGLNPALTYCPRCGGETNELMLLGDARVYQCQTCKQKMIGQHAESCPNGHGKMAYVSHYENEFGKRLPSRSLCDKCEEEVKEHKRIVADGGIYWKCSDCKTEGVIRYNELAHDVRMQLRVPPPKPCVIEFSKADCPVCGPNPVKP